MNKIEIHTEKITLGSRTYFFDIKKSVRNDFYLLVSESRRTKHGHEHHRLMVFEEDLGEFSNALRKSLAKFKELKLFRAANGDNRSKAARGMEATARSAARTTADSPAKGAP